MNTARNDLLAAILATASGKQLEPHLRTVELSKSRILAEPLQPMRQAYFLYSGLVSFSVLFKDGRAVQTAVVGRDGVVGAQSSLYHGMATSLIAVLVPGRAAVVDAERLAEIVQANADVRSLILAHERLFLSEVQLTAACNALHLIEQRVCKWLLRMNDLVGMTVPMTQELLAEMMGVRRTSVTLAATTLQHAGIIKYRRGNLEILDIDRLKQLSCECHQTLQEYYGIFNGGRSQ